MWSERIFDVILSTKLQKYIEKSWQHWIKKAQWLRRNAISPMNTHIFDKTWHKHDLRTIGLFTWRLTNKMPKFHLFHENLIFPRIAWKCPVERKCWKINFQFFRNNRVKGKKPYALKQDNRKYTFYSLTLLSNVKAQWVQRIYCLQSHWWKLID